jgi:hypothetical protein
MAHASPLTCSPGGVLPRVCVRRWEIVPRADAVRPKPGARGDSLPAVLSHVGRRRRRAQGGSPVGRIAGGGMAFGKVAGARSRGTRSRRSEEWQRLEAIKERKTLRREANEKHEKKRCFRLEARRAFQPARLFGRARGRAARRRGQCRGRAGGGERGALTPA